nr:hypothetical protein [uncultured Mucilaginibacter sp.]
MAGAFETIVTEEDVRKEVGYLIEDIRQGQLAIIKWMFIFWLAQVRATWLLFSCI